MQKQRIARSLALALFVGLALVLVASAATSTTPSGTTVQASFINVGQGDSVLLRDNSGFDVLVDGGTRPMSSTVLTYLRALGVDDIDVMVATHADSDHIGGLIGVLQATDIPVRAVLYNGYPADSTLAWQDFVAAVVSEGLTLTVAQYPSEYTWGVLKAYVLNPAPGLFGADNALELSDTDQNNASVVLRIEHGSIYFLLTGDIESTAESNVLARGVLLASQILKVAHHGSNGSSSGTFLAAVQPKEAVISVGPNGYGHPGADALNRLSAAGAWLWRTDEKGTLVFTSYGITYAVPGTRTQVFLPVVMRQTGQTSPADVQITYIEYDPPGDDVAGEYVRIQNVGGTGATMTNWTLCDLANNCYTFPAYALGAGATVNVWVKAGMNTQADLYWGRGSAVWNNTGDTAFLRDDAGALVDQYSYP